MFLDSDQFDGDILGGDADDLPDFLVAHVFEPKQDDGPIDHAKFVDAVIELLDLSGVVVCVCEEVDFHRERHGLHAVFLLALGGEAGVEGDAPNPSLHVTLPFERVEAPPQVDERFLEQVVHLILALREEIAHRVNGVFVPFHEARKFRFFLFHRSESFVYLTQKQRKNYKERKIFSKMLAVLKKVVLLHRNSQAEIAQLVEHDLAKVGVASSSLVFRSAFAEIAQLVEHDLAKVGVASSSLFCVSA